MKNKYQIGLENMVRKGEIACYKQFLLFSQCFLQLYISLVRQNAVLCGNGLNFEFAKFCCKSLARNFECDLWDSLSLFHTILTFNDPEKVAL